MRTFLALFIYLTICAGSWAWAQTITTELTTFYPNPVNADSNPRSLRVGTGYSTLNVSADIYDGVGLFFRRVGIGLPLAAAYPGARLEIRGEGASAGSTAHSLQIATGDTTPHPVFTVRNNRTVGINTDTPGANLVVRGIPSSATEDRVLHVYSSSESPILTAMDNGRVGIGTRLPGAALEIGASGDLLFKAAATSADNVGDIIFQTGGALAVQKGRLWTDAAPGQNKLHLSSADNTPDITIDATGNVGIGMLIPTRKLQVAGNVQVDGQLITTGSRTYLAGADPFAHWIMFGVTPTPGDPAPGERTRNALAFRWDAPGGRGYIGIGPPKTAVSPPWDLTLHKGDLHLVKGDLQISEGNLIVDHRSELVIDRGPDPSNSHIAGRFRHRGSRSYYEQFGFLNPEPVHWFMAGPRSPREEGVNNALGLYYNTRGIGGLSRGVWIGPPDSLTPPWNLVVWSGNLTLQRGEAFKRGTTWRDISDIRLKQNITPIEMAMEKMLRLRGVMFEWKDPKRMGRPEGPQMGMIGQEVEQVFPELVTETPDGYKAIGWSTFEALTIEAFRQLKSENDALKKRNEALEARINALEEKLAP